MTALLHIKKFAQDRLTVTAPHQGLYEITGDILAWLEGQAVTAGLLTLQRDNAQLPLPPSQARIVRRTLAFPL